MQCLHMQRRLDTDCNESVCHDNNIRPQGESKWFENAPQKCAIQINHNKAIV